MKSIHTVEQGAARYAAGPVEPYDQKNEMFKRPFWDPEMQDLRTRFYAREAPPENRPGYRLYDQSLVNAAWRLEREYALGVRGGRRGMYAWEWSGEFSYPHVPRGLKVAVDNPEALAQGVKKAARFFGACLVGICKLDRRWLYSRAYEIDA